MCGSNLESIVYDTTNANVAFLKEYEQQQKKTNRKNVWARVSFNEKFYGIVAQLLLFWAEHGATLVHAECKKLYGKYSISIRYLVNKADTVCIRTPCITASMKNSSSNVA